MHVLAKEFGINGKTYSLGLLTCVDTACPVIPDWSTGEANYWNV